MWATGTQFRPITMLPAVLMASTTRLEPKPQQNLVSRMERSNINSSPRIIPGIQLRIPMVQYWACRSNIAHKPKRCHFEELPSDEVSPFYIQSNRINSRLFARLRVTFLCLYGI